MKIKRFFTINHSIDFYISCVIEFTDTFVNKYIIKSVIIKHFSNQFFIIAPVLYADHNFMMNKIFKFFNIS